MSRRRIHPIAVLLSIVVAIGLAKLLKPSLGELPGYAAGIAVSVAVFALLQRVLIRPPSGTPKATGPAGDGGRDQRG